MVSDVVGDLVTYGRQLEHLVWYLRKCATSAKAGLARTISLRENGTQARELPVAT
jgi:hypothetical protein